MDKMVAFCGIVCTECLAFLATRKNDNAGRKKVAEMWFKQFNAKIQLEDINYDGCLSTGDKVFGYCKACEIRKCGLEKGVANCAYCEDYGCEKLNKFLGDVPAAKNTLEEIRKSIT